MRVAAFLFPSLSLQRGTSNIFCRISFHPSVFTSLFPRDPRERTKSRVAAFLFLLFLSLSSSLRGGETGVGVTRGHPYIGSSPTIYYTMEKSGKKERTRRERIRIKEEREREREFRISTFFPRLRIESGLIREWKRGSDFARVSLVDSNISRLLAFPVGTETTQASYFTRTYPRVDDASRRLSRFSLSLLRRDSLRNSLSLSPFLPFSLSLPRSRPLSLARERGMEKTLTEIFYRRTVSKQRRIVNRFDGHLDGIINEWRNDASAPLGRGPVYLAWDSVANRRSLGSRFVDRVGGELEKDGKTVGTKKTRRTILRLVYIFVLTFQRVFPFQRILR